VPHVLKTSKILLKNFTFQKFIFPDVLKEISIFHYLSNNINIIPCLDLFKEFYAVRVMQEFHYPVLFLEKFIFFLG